MVYSLIKCRYTYRRKLFLGLFTWNYHLLVRICLIVECTKLVEISPRIIFVHKLNLFILGVLGTLRYTGRSKTKGTTGCVYNWQALLKKDKMQCKNSSTKLL